MINSTKLRHESVRLGISYSDAKQLYRQITPGTTVPFPPKGYLHSGDKTAQIIGKDRSLYFENPRIATTTNSPNFRLYKLETRDINFTTSKTQNKQKKSQYYKDVINFSLSKDTKRDIGIQSAFRDQESQTIPYSSQISSELKITEYGSLKYGGKEHLLNPINLNTLKEIDKIRRRNNIEKKLPIGKDKKSFNKRCKLLKDLEISEWKEREDKIKIQQKISFKKLKRNLERVNKEIKEKNSVIIDRVSKKVYDKLEVQLKKIRKHRGKLLQKYNEKENSVNEKKKKSMNRSSFNNTTRSSVKEKFNLPLYKDFHLIEKIEKKYLKFKRIDIEHELHKIKKQDEFKKTLNLKKLKQIKKSNSKNSTNNDLLNLYRKTPRIYRPQTPSLQFNDDNDAEENAIILIQKLLRGRSIQNQFCIAKQKALSLIKELQEVEKVITKEREILKNIDQKKKNDNLLLLDHYNIIDNIQGQIMGNTLNYLSKELVRKNQINELLVLNNKAVQERDKREKKEKNKREKELKNNINNNQIKFDNLLINRKLNIQSYIKNEIFEKTIKKYSYNKALNEVRSLDKNNIKNNKATKENQIRNLVSSFIIPQVKREIQKKKLHNENSKYLKSVSEIKPKLYLK